jgi:hypothetical protein
MLSRKLKFLVVPEQFAVIRLDPDAPVPAWASTGALVSITRTEDELSVVCPAISVPAGVPCKSRYSCLKVRGPLDFSETGVLASMASPLSEAGISLFALSTYETDYILVAQEELERALAALTRFGHELVEIQGEVFQ